MKFQKGDAVRFRANAVAAIPVEWRRPGFSDVEDDVKRFGGTKLFVSTIRRWEQNPLAWRPSSFLIYGLLDEGNSSTKFCIPECMLEPWPTNDVVMEET